MSQPEEARRNSRGFLPGQGWNTADQPLSPLPPLGHSRTKQDWIDPSQATPLQLSPRGSKASFSRCSRKGHYHQRTHGNQTEGSSLCPRQGSILLANPQPSCPGLKRDLLARHSGQAQPEFPSSFQTTQAPGRHAQKSHWREAGRWHRVASPDNSTRRKMAGSVKYRCQEPSSPRSKRGPAQPA